MKSKLVTSLILGPLLPWVYFLFVTVGPARYTDSDGNTTIGESGGVTGFIEFYGALESTIIYVKTSLTCAVLVFSVCIVYTFAKSYYEE
jgi:hypothetical protein